MKRKGGAGGSQQPPRAKLLAGGGGSRYVCCPCCSKSVPAATLDHHLNTCGVEAAPQPATAGQAAAAAAAQPIAALAAPAAAQAATAVPPLSLTTPASCPQPGNSATQQQWEEPLGSSTGRPSKAPAVALHDDGASGAAAAAAAAKAAAAAATTTAATAAAAAAPPPPPPPPPPAAGAGPQQHSNGTGKPTPSSSSSCWWQRPSAVVAMGHQQGGRQVGLTTDALFAAAQCELVPNFLPAELAQRLLKQLQADSPGWERMQWWIGGGSGGGGGGGGGQQQQPGLSNKTNCHYLLAAEGPNAHDLRQQQDAGGTKPRQPQHQQQQEEQDAGAGVEGGAPMQAPAPEVLRLAGDMVACHVSQRIQSGAMAGLPLESDDRQGWAPSDALANCYADGASSVGCHSDRLTPLGPTPIIASLSLGATRTFRLHRQLWLDLKGVGDGRGGSTASAAAAAAAGVSRVDVELPHNALCVMWPPCQEAWKHEVPKTSRPFPRHPTSGSTRYNLTFRRTKPQWEEKAPLCRCGRRAVMKARQAQEAGDGGFLSYYYACDASMGPTCGFWQACPTRVVL